MRKIVYTKSHRNLVKVGHSVRQLLSVSHPIMFYTIVAEIDDLFKVKTKIFDVAGRWEYIGQALGLGDRDLQTIKKECQSNIEECSRVC